MKKIIYSILVSCVCIGITGCKKDIQLYNGEEGIYFAVQRGPSHGNENVWAYQRNTPVEFLNIVGQTDTLKLRVMITGAVKNYDRPFSVVMNTDSTTAIADVNYEPLKSEYMIKAGNIDAFVEVVLNRADNIKKAYKTLGLKLVPGKDFTLSIQNWKKLPGSWVADIPGDFNPSLHKIVMSDFVTKPPRWAGSANATSGIEGGLWGEFSEKKYRLICERFDLVYKDFLDFNVMPDPKRANIQEVMVRYLQELYDKKTPVLEEDGRLMFFSGVSWTSKLGVPYTP